MKINVIALESSGRHWVDSMLRQHPDLKVFGISYPCLGWPDRFYPILPLNVDVLVIVVRDPNCQEQSAIDRNFHADVPEGLFTPELSRQAVMEQVDIAIAHGIKVLFFDYEAALVYRQKYLDWFFCMIGVPTIELHTEWRDENKKYFAHENRPALPANHQEARPVIHGTEIL